MLKYVVMGKMEELLDIEREYKKQLGIQLSDYRKYKSLQEQWENLTRDISNNSEYEKMFSKFPLTKNYIISDTNFTLIKKPWIMIQACRSYHCITHRLHLFLSERLL